MVAFALHADWFGSARYKGELVTENGVPDWETLVEMDTSAQMNVAGLIRCRAGMEHFGSTVVTKK